MDGFADKLTLVIKTLGISRAELGAALAVDKSVVSRWFAGARAPTAHNLAAITALIAARAPGFTLLDWDRDLAGLAAALAGRGAERPLDTADQDDITLRLPPTVAAAARARSEAFEGFWRITFSPGASDRPNTFLYSFVLAYKGPNGLLLYRAGTMGAAVSGWCLPMGTQLTTVGIDATNGTISMQIFNAPANRRLTLMDGVHLTWRDGIGGSPLAGACVIERIGDLSGDDAVDDATFADLLAQSPVAPEGAVPDLIQRTLLRDVGPSAAALGGDLMLTMPFFRTIAQGE